MALNDTLDTLGVTGDWEFNETSGTSAAARVGSDSLDIGAGVTLGATGGGNEGDTAFDFAGGSSTTDYVQEYTPTDEESYDADVKASRSLWIPLRCDDLTNDQQVIWQIGGRHGGVFIYITAAGDIRLNISNGSGLNYSGIITGQTEGSWGSIGFVQRDSANEIDLYSNGSNVATIDISSVISKTMQSTLVIGSAQGNGSISNDRVRKHDNGVISLANSAFDGAIERVSYFSGVELTDTQMSDLHDEWLNGASSDDHTLAPAELSVTSQLDAATMTQVHILSPDDMSVSSTLDGATIVQNHILTPVDGSVTSQLDQSGVTEEGDAHTLSPVDSSVTSQLDGTTITQNHVLSPVDGSVTSQLDQSGVAEENDDVTFSPADGSVTSQLDGAVMTQNHVLSPDDGSVTVQLDSTTLVQNHIISPADLSVTSELDQATLDFSVIFSPSDLSVSSQLDTTAISQVHILSPDDGSVVATLDTTLVTQVHILGPADLTVTSELASATLTLPSGVVRATISLGTNYSGSVSLGTTYSGSTSLGSF